MEVISVEEKIMAVANRFFDVKKEVQKKLKELKIMMDVAGFSIIEEGNMDEPTIYSHKDFEGITFYDEDMDGSIKAYKKDKKGDDVQVNNNSDLNKLVKFLNVYCEQANDIWREVILDENDYLVGEYITDSSWEEYYINIEIDDHYRIEFPVWIKKVDEINVYYLLKQPRPEEDFWKNYKAKIEQKKKIDARLKELDKPVGKKNSSIPRKAKDLAYP